MSKKMKFLKSIIAMSTLFIVAGTVGCSSTEKNKELESSNVTLITKVLPGGEVSYAMVCDYGTNVDASSLSVDSFLVESTVGDITEARTITKVYTNDSVATSESSKEGRYVVVELNPEDANATTFTFDMEKFLNERLELQYTITQKSDIKTSDGITFKLSDKKISNSQEVTPVVNDFKEFTYNDPSGNKLDYRLFEPVTNGDEKYPLILFLHGSGERGSDNAMQLLGNQGATIWADPEVQTENPCYVLAPQAPAQDQLTFYWTEEPNYSSVVNLLKETISKYNIDPDRIYVEGMSNGGIGTWNIIEDNPDLFAAAIPICGIPDIKDKPFDSGYAPITDTSRIALVKDMPIWQFHAADDPLVDVRYSRNAVETINSLGGTEIKYTEYE